MEKLTKIVNETLVEFNESNNPYHIIVQFERLHLEKLKPLTEGRWLPSEEKGYWKRLDTPKFDFEYLHVHIAKEKHINSKDKQVSWNVNGDRHDKKSFNNNFVGMETAKQIARNALGLPDNFKLECISNKGKANLILESFGDIPENTSLYVFVIVKNQILKS